MNVVFIIGFAITILAIIPRIMLASWMYKQLKENENMPLKMQELKAEYRRRRWQILIVQIVGIIIAIVGLNYM